MIKNNWFTKTFDALRKILEPIEVGLLVYIRMFFMALILKFSFEYLDYTRMSKFEGWIFLLAVAVWILQPAGRYFSRLYYDYKYKDY